MRLTWRRSWPRWRPHSGLRTSATSTATSFAHKSRARARRAQHRCGKAGVHLKGAALCRRMSLNRSCRRRPRTQGNPFKAFWEGFGVTFVGEKSVTYGMTPAQWEEELPASEHPVVAMPGAPASFPTQLVQPGLKQRGRSMAPRGRPVILLLTCLLSHFVSTPLPSPATLSLGCTCRMESAVEEKGRGHYCAAPAAALSGCAHTVPPLTLTPAPRFPPPPPAHTLDPLSLIVPASTGRAHVSTQRADPTWRARSATTCGPADRA